VWGCALAWFLLNGRVKLLVYRILDPAEALSDSRPVAFRQSVGTGIARGTG
jgi:hypothetical protein